MHAAHFFTLLALLFAPAAAWMPHWAPKALNPALARKPVAAATGPRLVRALEAKKSGGGGKPSGGGEKGGDKGGGGDGGQERSKKGAGVATLVIEKTDAKVEEATKEALDDDTWWRVLLHNDEIHTFEYVVESVVKVVPTLTKKKAFVISRVVHTTGQGTITTVWKSMAMQICLGLQTFGLTASIAPDNKFSGEGNIQASE